MSRFTRHILGGLIIGGALLATGTTRLSACSCIGPIVACESAWTTDAIFVGKVVNVGPLAEVGGQFPRRQRLVRFDVQEAFKGVPVAELEIATGAGDADCGYNFVHGRTYVVYAHRNVATGQLGAGICSRTGPIEQASEDLAYLRGPFASPSDMGSVRGTVTRFDPPRGPNQPPQRAPFPGADIRLEGYARVYTTTSADDGSYAFQVPAGEYRIFANVRDGVYAWPGPDGRTVTLHDRRGCAVTDITVRPDGRIAGRLLDASGAPLPFMSVELTDASRTSAISLTAASRTLTNDHGRFEFKELAPGQYVPGVTLVRNRRQGTDLAVWIDTDASGQPATVTVAPEGRVDLGPVRLPAGVTTHLVSGVVVSADGSPVRAAGVRFIEAGPISGMLGSPVITGDDGRFVLSVIAGRSYRLSAEWSTPPTVARRYASARSEPFVATGDLKPFRLVLDEVR